MKTAPRMEAPTRFIMSAGENEIMAAVQFVRDAVIGNATFDTNAAEALSNAVEDALHPNVSTGDTKKTLSNAAVGGGSGIARAAAKSRVRDLPPAFGAGGFGKVFIYNDSGVAFKRGPISSTLREAAVMRLCGVMNVPCVMPLLDAAADPRAAFITIAMPAGACDVHRIIRRAATNVTLATRTRWLRALIAAVSGLHAANIIHCDIKPSNMILAIREEVAACLHANRSCALLADIRALIAVASKPTLDDDNSHRRREAARAGLVVGSSLLSLTLSDFGLSRVVRSSATDLVFSNNPDAAYTESYRAPEVRRECAWGAPADIWALACSVVEIYTGAPAIPNGDDITPLTQLSHITTDSLQRRGVPAGVASLICCTLRNPFDPRARPTSCEFMSALECHQTAVAPPSSVIGGEGTERPPFYRSKNNNGVRDLKTVTLAKYILSAFSAQLKPRHTSRRLRVAGCDRITRACFNLADALMHNSNAFLDREEIALAETLKFDLFSQTARSQ